MTISDGEFLEDLWKVLYQDEIMIRQLQPGEKTVAMLVEEWGRPRSSVVRIIKLMEEQDLLDKREVILNRHRCWAYRPSDTAFELKKDTLSLSQDKKSDSI